MKKSTIKVIFDFAKECKDKLLLSIFFAIISVMGGIIPYLGVYQIIISFFEGHV